MTGEANPPQRPGRTPLPAAAPAGRRRLPRTQVCTISSSHSQTAPPGTVGQRRQGAPPAGREGASVSCWPVKQTGMAVLCPHRSRLAMERRVGSGSAHGPHLLTVSVRTSAAKSHSGVSARSSRASADAGALTILLGQAPSDRGRQRPPRPRCLIPRHPSPPSRRQAARNPVAATRFSTAPELCDEAHLLEPAQLEELRLLSSAEMDSAKPGTAWYASRTGPSSTSAAPAAATAP